MGRERKGVGGREEVRERGRNEGEREVEGKRDVGREGEGYRDREREEERNI